MSKGRLWRPDGLDLGEGGSGVRSRLDFEDLAGSGSCAILNKTSSGSSSYFPPPPRGYAEVVETRGMDGRFEKEYAVVVRLIPGNS